jgi:hypothetical protein
MQLLGSVPFLFEIILLKSFNKIDEAESPIVKK